MHTSKSVVDARRQSAASRLPRLRPRARPLPLNAGSLMAAALAAVVELAKSLA